MKVEEYYDRVARHGVGQAKAGGNYSASLLPLKIAHDEGYNELVYLDPVEHKYFEEISSSNIFFVFLKMRRGELGVFFEKGTEVGRFIKA